MSRPKKGLRRKRGRVPRPSWLDLTPTVLRVTVVLLVTGSLLTALGFWADTAGIWNDLPFLVNMVSSAAAACFGVPVALVVLQYLLRQQDDHSNRVIVKRLIAAAAVDLDEAAAALVPSESRFCRVEEDVQSLLNFLAPMDPVHPSIPGPPHPNGAGFYTSDVCLTSERLDEAVSKLKGIKSQLGLAMGSDGRQTLWKAEETWLYMDRQLRLQAVGAGVKWVDTGTSEWIRSYPWRAVRDRWEYFSSDRHYVVETNKNYPANAYFGPLEERFIIINNHAEDVRSFWRYLGELQQLTSNVRQQLAPDNPGEVRPIRFHMPSYVARKKSEEVFQSVTGEFFDY